MTEYRASRYLKIIDETLAMVATVSSARTNHGRPNEHTDPHVHDYVPNPSARMI
jgi:hypothetical protein